MNKSYETLKGSLYVVSNVIPTFHATHDLKLNENISYYLLSNLDMLIGDLHNGVFEKVPSENAGDAFKKANSGIGFLAYFPLADAERLIKSEKCEHLKATFKRLEKGAKKTYAHILDKAGFEGFPDVADTEYQIAKNKTIHIKGNIDSLTGVMDIIFNEYDSPYLLVQRGFGLSECAPNDDTRVEFILLGEKEDTENFVDLLKKDSDIASQAIAGLFSSDSKDVAYRGSKTSDVNRFYNSEPFLKGNYNPFKNMKELRIFDYRE